MTATVNGWEDEPEAEREQLAQFWADFEAAHPEYRDQPPPEEA